MKSKLIFISTMIMLLMLFGCGDNITKIYGNGETDGRVIGTIHGIVTDANTNERLVNVDVTWLDEDEIQTTTTNALGYYFITDLSPGDYELTFSGNEGFAVGRIIVTIPTLDEIGVTNVPTDEDFYHTEIQDMEMYQLNAGLTGTIYTIIDDENIALASGVIVIADFENWDISPEEYSATTGINGIFIFENLPSTPEVVLRTLPFTDSTYSFEVVELDLVLFPNAIVTVPNIFLNIVDDPPFIVENNFDNDNFGIIDAIEITFNKAIDPNSFDVELYSDIADPVEFESITWLTDASVVITPDEELLLATVYTMNISGCSVDGNFFDFPGLQFETQPGIDVESTNLEIYDNYYEIAPMGTIIINFTEEVDIYNGLNVLTITGYPDPAYVWSNNNKTLSIAHPTGGYTGNFILEIIYYSTLASYDFVNKIYTVNLIQ